jgi:general secretion pathway protein M
MSISERLSRLEPRERRLLAILGGVVGFMMFLAIPIGVAASVHSQASANQALRDAVSSIDDARGAVDKARVSRDLVARRYERPAPPLAAFLARVASEANLEIPESQDRQAVPHGKRYSERSTKITLRKVGMLKLAKLMEKIETSGHPVSISALDIRKRVSEPDSFDVDMVVSAFDRKAPEPKKAEETPPTGAAQEAE